MPRLLAFAALLALPLAQLGDSIPATLRALQLPALVTEARQAGVPDAMVRELLDGLRRRGLSADEAAMVVGEAFGTFVYLQLGAGQRGRALAEANPAEHRARGVGLEEGSPSQRRDTIRPKGVRP